MAGWGGQTERIYLVRTEEFELAPEWTAAQLAAEGIGDQRWYSLDELDDGVRYSPRRLPQLVRDLVERGAPATPLDVGV
jgi:hypothetical protein